MTKVFIVWVNDPAELWAEGPSVRRIVLECESEREGTVFIRSRAAGLFPKRAAIREQFGSLAGQENAVGSKAIHGQVKSVVRCFL